MIFENPQILFQYTEVLQKLLREALRQFQAERGAFMFFNPSTGKLDIEAFCGPKNERKKIHLSAAELMAQHNKCFRHCEEKGVLMEGMSSELAISLEQAGQGIGLLYIASRRKNAFKISDEKRIQDFSRRAIEWIKFIWEVDRLKIKSSQFESLLSMGQAIVSQEMLSHVLQKVARESHALMKAKLSSIMLLSDDGAELQLAAWHGASQNYIRKPHLQVSDSLLGIVVRRQKPMTVLNVQKDTRYQYGVLAKKEKLISLLAVPLVFKEQVLGVLTIYTDQQHRFSDEEVRLLRAMADLSAVVIAKAQMTEKIARVEENLKVSEKLSALGWLAAEVAHEIRNPLTVMQMLFHSLVKSLDLDREAQRDASLIKTKMQQMNLIVERVLTFAQSSEPLMEMVDVISMMDDLALLIRHKLAEQKIEIKQNFASDIPPIRGDRAQLEQAILNLVLNACQAMPHGGMLTLSARFKKEKSAVILTIKDTGEGISAKRQKTLFQPLMSYRKGGVGLGLTLVQKIIELHQGNIAIKSRLGKGSTFQISLPAESIE